MVKRLVVLLALTATAGCVDFADEASRSRGVEGEDAGSDGGAMDAGSSDAGSTDAGSTDAGSTDAGSTDAGSDAGASLCPADMTWVDGGSYLMGARFLADGGDEMVTVAAFCLDLTEVTVASFRLPDGGLAPTTPAECNGNRGDRQNHPVNCIDWNEAGAHCGNAGKRLPTEEEWEWAARGGLAGNRFPWGSSAPQNEACWRGASVPAASTCPVGSFPSGTLPNGLADLAGNVWEWTSSCSVCPNRVYRGGGWYDTTGANLAVTLRYQDPIGTRNFNIGVRCARSL